YCPSCVSLGMYVTVLRSSILTRPAPISTLVPYTTLFRSAPPEHQERRHHRSQYPEGVEKAEPGVLAGHQREEGKTDDRGREDRGRLEGEIEHQEHNRHEQDADREIDGHRRIGQPPSHRLGEARKGQVESDEILADALAQPPRQIQGPSSEDQEWQGKGDVWKPSVFPDEEEPHTDCCQDHRLPSQRRRGQAHHSPPVTSPNQ